MTPVSGKRALPYDLFVMPFENSKRRQEVCTIHSQCPAILHTLPVLNHSPRLAHCRNILYTESTAGRFEDSQIPYLGYFGTRTIPIGRPTLLQRSCGCHFGLRCHELCLLHERQILDSRIGHQWRPLDCSSRKQGGSRAIQEYCHLRRGRDLRTRAWVFPFRNFCQDRQECESTLLQNCKGSSETGSASARWRATCIIVDGTNSNRSIDRTSAGRPTS